MKSDPFVQPLNLAIQHGGPWEYHDEKTGATITDVGFWTTARKLSSYRRRNGLPRAGYEDCQYDLLVAKRKQLGLPLDLQEPARPMLPPKPILGVAIIARQRGCAGCGKTKPL